MLVQIAPGRAGAGDPEHAVEYEAMIGRRPAAAGPLAHKEGSEERPLVVTHRSANQVLLPKSSLESELRGHGNPLCLHGLIFRNDREEEQRR
jgi:hypothetical protein